MSAESPETRSSDPQTWTVRRIIDWTTAHLARHNSPTPRLDAEILLAHARNCRRIELYTRYHEVLSDAERSTMRELVRRRAAAEPVAYLVGHREFFGLSMRVTHDVLIPRPETETLVLELLDAARQLEAPRVLDVGTGSGCIAVAVAANHPGALVTAVDSSPQALCVAAENARTHHVAGRIELLEGDLFAPLSAGAKFDFIVSNPPYVAEGDRETLSADIVRHEPHQALFAGADGLTVIRRLIAETPEYLEPGGRLLFEFSPEQATAIDRLIESNRAYEQCVLKKDLSGNVRVAIARLAQRASCRD